MPLDADFNGTKRFQVLGRLGEGGMGVVYRALDHERNMHIALKTLRTMSPPALLRFKKEFRALQGLQHPNLVTLYELIEDAGNWFFTMELVEGVDFLSYVRPGLNGADETRLRQTLAQLAGALVNVHELSLVHRDIKPSNILITREGRVVLLDFGLAAELEGPGSHASTENQVVGTAAYMAPEQAASKPVGPEADWYSVGVLLYEALTGKWPHSGAPLEILMQKQQAEPTPPHALVPGVAEDLDRLCGQLLRFDPRKRPSGAEVLEKLVRDPKSRQAIISASASFTQTGTFVGRVRELDILAGALAETRSGKPVLVVIHGDSGVGKSALVRHFLEEGGDETVALVGRCYERESVPYKAFDGVIDSLSQYLARLPERDSFTLLPRHVALLAEVFPVLRRVPAIDGAPRAAQGILDPQEQRTRAFAAFRELLARLADRRPIVVVIDDLQWADADSLALLGEVIREPDPPAVLLLATWRTVGEGPDDTPARLERVSSQIRHLELERLSDEEAHALASALIARSGGVAADDVARAIAKEAAGHPLFIDELVRHSVSAPGPAPSRLDEALWTRISRLDAMTQRLLEGVVVAGVPIEQGIAGRAAGLDAAQLERHVSLLRVANLVRTGGGRGGDKIEPYHDRVRDAVFGHLEAPERQAWHRALARSIELSNRADDEALAIHYRGAGDLDKAALHATRAAAAATVALAFDRAARLYRLVLELMPHHPDRRMLISRLGDSLANSGRGAEAARAYLDAAEGAPAADTLDLQRRAAQQLLVTGHIDDGLATLRTVLASEGMSYPKTPRRALLQVILRRLQLKLRGTTFRRRDETEVSTRELAKIDICWHAGLGFGMADNIRGHSFQIRCLLLALQAGEPYRLSRALAAEAAYVSSLGAKTWPKVEAAIATAEQLAKESGRPQAEAFVLGVRGTATFLTGQFRASLEYCRIAEHMFREQCVGVPWEIATMLVWSARSLYWLGEIDELARLVPAMIRECGERGDLYGATSLRASILPIARLAADEPALAQADVLQALKEWSPSGFHVQHYYGVLSQCAVAMYEGDGAGALERIRRDWARLSGSMLMRVQNIRVHIFDTRGRAALAAAERSQGDRERMLAIAKRDVRLLAREGASWAKALSLLLEAGIENVRGRAAEALVLLRSAADAFAATDLQLHANVARLRSGEIAGGEEGVAQVGNAQAWMKAQRIRDPNRLTDMLAPGFRPEQ